MEGYIERANRPPSIVRFSHFEPSDVDGGVTEARDRAGYLVTFQSRKDARASPENAIDLLRSIFAFNKSNSSEARL